jgi:hypothetical protein
MISNRYIWYVRGMKGISQFFHGSGIGKIDGEADGTGCILFGTSLTRASISRTIPLLFI